MDLYMCDTIYVGTVPFPVTDCFIYVDFRRVLLGLVTSVSLFLFTLDHVSKTIAVKNFGQLSGVCTTKVKGNRPIRIQFWR